MPGPGQLTIRVTLTGVNFADIIRRRGGPPPFTPGLDCAGTIRAVGDGVTDLHPGQRVAAFPDDGGYTDIALARPVLTYPLPDGVPDEAGVSLTMVTIARELGASVGIDHTRDDLSARVAAATGGHGVDVVLDAVGGKTFDATLPLLAEFGRSCVYGQASGEPGEVKTNTLHGGNRAVLGYSTGGYRAARPGKLREGVEGAFELVAAGKVRIVAGKRFALRDAAEARRFVESRAGHGKVFLAP